jgi:hypothetical protein
MHTTPCYSDRSCKTGFLQYQVVVIYQFRISAEHISMEHLNGVGRLSNIRMGFRLKREVLHCQAFDQLVIRVRHSLASDF